MEQDAQTAISKVLGTTTPPAATVPETPDAKSIIEKITGSPAPTSSTYEVKPGDNLTKIAKETGTTVDKISGYSSGDPNLIKPGEKLTIPDSKDSTEAATSGALLGGANPSDLLWARKNLGSREYNGYCQKFVRLAAGVSDGASAIQAWQQNQNKVEGTLEGIKPGDLVYFSPNQSNEGYGHTGIYSGDGKFISATDNGVAEYNFNDWNQLTKQNILGYIPNQSQPIP